MKTSSLLKLFFKRNSLNNKNIRLFSASAGHLEHGGNHHEHTIHLNQTQNWIATTDSEKEFVSLFGFKDAHDSHFHPDTSNPWPNVYGKPIFTFERLYFSDAHINVPEEEPLWNTPHGYLTSDNPLDTRNLMERPSLELILIMTCLFAGICLVGHSALQYVPTHVQLYRDNLTAEYIENDIREIRIKNKELEDKRDELKKQLTGEE